MSILLNELMKLVLYAGCKNVTFFRMGTCGGIGLKPGTLVVSEEAVDGMFRPQYRQVLFNYFQHFFHFFLYEEKYNVQ